ncbi:MAG: T6SS phospholipase effector Tle1-like catalytic domain-containing protein [Sulfitobacter sp.]
MPKDIVLLLDGTSNEIKTDRSNVLRFYGTLQKSDAQVVFYDPGVGTFGAENAWSRLLRKGHEVWGMATGWGFDTNVKEAYRFLVENYEVDANGERDRIHIIGFSRGAYCARVLAGFLHAFGLMERRNLNLLDYAYRAYKRIGGSVGEDAFAELRLHERILRPDRPTIRFLGLFDTVSSVIESGRFGPRLRSHAFTDHNPSVQTLRHAVAIHERRTMFRPQLWSAGQDFHPNRFSDKGKMPQDAREVWFSGVHGDIGGGYPEAVSGLAKLPLHWMILQSRKAGLKHKTRTINSIVLGKDDKYTDPDPLAKANRSMTPVWRIVEYLPRRKPKGSTRSDLAGWIIPRAEARAIPDGACVHSSVLDRFNSGGGRPENMPENYTEEP